MLLLFQGCQKEAAIPAFPPNGNEIERRSEGLNLDLSPTSYNFRKVEIGETKTIEASLKNLGEKPICGIISIQIITAWDNEEMCPDFSLLIEVEDLELENNEICLGPGEALAFDIYLSVSAICEDYSNSFGIVRLWFVADPNQENPVVGYYDMLIHAGPILPTELTEYFKEELENGKLVMSNKNQLKAFEKQLSLIEHFYADEKQKAACDKLAWLWERCDGDPAPPDWIEGDGKEAFAGFIRDVMDYLGCE